MGFKNITPAELRIKQGPNFVGIPLKHVGQLIKEEEIETKKVEVVTSIDQASEILLENDETLNYQYLHDGEIKNMEGYGNISIYNNSSKDRIWDTQIHLTGTQYNSLDAETKMNLGIFEPKTSRNIKYNITNLEELPEALKISEDIEFLNEEMEGFRDMGTGGDAKNYFLMYGKLNDLRFTIKLENVSSSTITNINLTKAISKSFYDLRIDTEYNKNIRFSRNTLDWVIPSLSPGQKVVLAILGKIKPMTKENIRTGSIDLTYTIKDHAISGIKLENFSAYSHAMHAINKIEIDESPDNWRCSLIFKNRCSFPIKLNSIIVTDKAQSTKYLNVDLKDEESLILPGNNYSSSVWEIKDENEPKFSRKLEYSVLHSLHKNTDVVIHVSDEVFNIVGLQIRKEILEKEIKSFEGSKINVSLRVDNMGTIPLKGILLKEIIPGDFLPDNKISDYKFKNSSGDVKSDNFNLNIIPPDEDSTKQHVIELTNKKQMKDVIGSDDFLELSYSFNAISPDNKKDYKFPLEVKSFYLKYKDQAEMQDFKFEDQAGLKVFYVKEDVLSKEEEAPSVQVSHKRRKVSIGKEIFPGRTHDEFAIVVHVKNKSNVKLDNLEITDNFPQSFELISSNIKNKVSKNDKESTNTITFNVDSILPYDEKEIMYYLKNITGKEIQFSELESFFYS